MLPSTTGTGTRHRERRPLGRARRPHARQLLPGTNKAHSADTTGDNPWGLVPDELPHMEYSPADPGRLCATGLTKAESIADGHSHAAITPSNSSFEVFPSEHGPHAHFS